jgi:hypothetical protein
MDQDLTTRIFPENSIRRKPCFWARRSVAENRARAFGGNLVPEGEAVLADQFHAAAAAARNTAAVD